MIPVRVLIADNSVEELAEAKKELRRFGDDVVVVTARDKAEAFERIEEAYFDVAFVDLFLDEGDREPYGQDVLARLATRSPSCLPVLMTLHGRSRPGELVAALSADKRQGLVFVDKGYQQYREIVSTRFKRRLEQKWTIGDFSEITAQLRTHQQRMKELRTSEDAVAEEVERLLFAMFDEPAGISLLEGAPHLSIVGARRGQSESATAQAQLSYGHDNDGKEVLGLRCFLKFGPRKKIAKEIKRYSRLVRIGVPSNFRVELIASALGDTLGSICYSFVDAGSSSDIQSFDDLVAAKALGKAEHIVDRLFDPEAKSWDGIRGPERSFQEYYTDLFDGVDFDGAVDEVLKFARKHLPGTVTPNGEYYFATESLKARLPMPADLRQPYWRTERATCMVHGDMHGGNLLIGEDPDQAWMIDYATAGIGPRFADAAALAASVRLHRPSDGELGPLFEDLFRLEKRLLRGPNAIRDASALNESWFRLGQHIDGAALRNVQPIGEIPKELRRELAVTQWTYLLSIFRLKRWSVQQKTHMIAWGSALHDVWANG